MHPILMRNYCCLLFLLLTLVACSGGGGDPDAGGVGATPAEFAETQLLVMLSEPDEFEDEESTAEDDFLEDFGGLALDRIGTTSFFVITIPAGQDPRAVLKDLDDDLRVVFTELDYVASAPVGGPSGSATLGSELLDLISTQPGLQPLALDLAHTRSRGAGVVVALIDSGIDFTNPYFAGRIAPGGRDFIGQDMDPTDERNFTDDDGDGLIDEGYGHGTFAASLVLAVAPEAQLLPVRVLDDEGFGTASGVAAGIIWAVDQGAHVINVSIDIPVESEIVKDAVKFARERGIPVVSAAGNESLTELRFPSRLDIVFAVTSVDEQGRVAGFSNVGSKVNIAAPGVDLLGAVPLDLNPVGTARWSGTSFSAPIVAGSIALLRAAYPSEDVQALSQRLTSTALDLDAINPSLRGEFGSGLVQPAAALE